MKAAVPQGAVETIALSGSINSIMKLHVLGAIPHPCDKTASENKSMEEGIVLAHGFRGRGPMLLDSMLLSKIAEEETYRRNLHFLMDKKQRVGPTGSKDNIPSRTCCQ